MTTTDLVHPETTSPVFRYGPWTWREPSHGEHFRTCSFCGSIHPDDLAAEPVWSADWADRKYGWPHKFYVDIPHRQPDGLFVVSSMSGGRPDRELDPGWVRWDDLTDEQRAIAARDGLDREPHPLGVRFGTRLHHHAKFYSVHLADLRVSPEVKRTVERRSGLHFEFRDGRVSWSRAEQ